MVVCEKGNQELEQRFYREKWVRISLCLKNDREENNIMVRNSSSLTVLSLQYLISTGKNYGVLGPVPLLALGNIPA